MWAVNRNNNDGRDINIFIWGKHHLFDFLSHDYGQHPLYWEFVVISIHNYYMSSDNSGPQMGSAPHQMITIEIDFFLYFVLHFGVCFLYICLCLFSGFLFVGRLKGIRRISPLTNDCWMAWRNRESLGVWDL